MTEKKRVLILIYPISWNMPQREQRECSLCGWQADYVRRLKKRVSARATGEEIWMASFDSDMALGRLQSRSLMGGIQGKLLFRVFSLGAEESQLWQSNLVVIFPPSIWFPVMSSDGHKGANGKQSCTDRDYGNGCWRDQDYTHTHTLAHTPGFLFFSTPQSPDSVST